MSKRANTRWIDQWMAGGIGSIQSRIAELREELSLLEQVQRALEPVSKKIESLHPTANPLNHQPRKKKSTRKGKKLSRTVPSPFRDKVYGELTDSWAAANIIAKKVGITKIEAVYTPLNRLVESGLVEMSKFNKVRHWRRVS